MDIQTDEASSAKKSSKCTSTNDCYPVYRLIGGRKRSKGGLQTFLFILSQNTLKLPFSSVGRVSVFESYERIESYPSKRRRHKIKIGGCRIKQRTRAPTTFFKGHFWTLLIVPGNCCGASQAGFFDDVLYMELASAPPEPVMSLNWLAE